MSNPRDKENDGSDFIKQMNETSYSIQTLNKSDYIDHKSLQNTKNYIILHCNIRSLDCNSDNLHNFLQEMNHAPDIICLSEIWSNFNDFNIQGYQPIVQNLRKNKRGGGVGIILKQNIDYQLIDEMTYINDNIEIITVKISNVNTKRLISAVYRPPSTLNQNINSFTSHIEKNLLLSRSKFSEPLKYDLCGDININLFNQNTNNSIQNFCQMIESNGFYFGITRCTRIQNGSKTLIDNIICNDISRNNSIFSICPIEISDHFPIIKQEITKTNKISPPPQDQHKIRIFSELNISLFKANLLDNNWNEILTETNTENKWNRFFKKIDSSFNLAFPKKIKQPHRHNNNTPWINKEIRTDIKKEQKLYRKKLINDNTQNKTIHKEFKLQLKKKIRKAKIDYYENFFKKNKHNPKKIWEKLNNMTKNSNKTNNIDKISVNNQEITSKSDIANNFNSFFQSAGKEATKNIDFKPIQHSQYMQNLKNTQNAPPFKFRNISQAELIKCTKSLKPKNSAGPDEIPTKIIKIAALTIPHVFQHIINQSLSTGFIHQRCKNAILIPIHKKNDKLNMTNYRPISIINSISKILEKIVAQQLNEHLETNNLLYKLQFGFRKKHNTQQAMLIYLDYLEKMKQENKITCSSFIDLSKAFDTVDHKILIEKLKTFGINGTELDWFYNYLNNRQQKCKVNHIFSKWLTLITGIPQGSILGPILFILFINDLPLFTKAFTSIFADDTKLSISAPDLNTVENELNKQLKNASTWFDNNKLALNPAKSRIITYNSKAIPLIYINNTIIQSISSKNINKEEQTFKFLGFHLDETLNFNAHTIKIMNKLKSTNYILNKNKRIMPITQKMMIYNALFKSHCEYGISIWGSLDNNLKRISCLQKTAINHVNNTFKRHSEPLLRKYKTLKIQDIKYLNDISIAHSIIHGYAPNAISNSIQRITAHERLRRNTNNLHYTTQNPKSISKHIIPKSWNNLSDELKKVTQKKVLQSKLKRISLTKYTKNEICTNQTCFSCKSYQ